MFKASPSGRSGTDPEAEMGPLVTRQHLDRVRSYVDLGVREGAKLVVDGRGLRLQGYENGFFMGGCLFDEVKPEMRIYREEIFGPVLAVGRAADFEEATSLVNQHEYGNRVAIFTRDGDTAREFANRVPERLSRNSPEAPVITTLRQFVEQRFGILQIGGVEALGEPAVDRGEQRVRLGGLALVAPQPGEAGGGAQFPRLRLLRTGALDRPPIGSFRPIRSSRVPPQEQIAQEPMHFRLPWGVAAPALEVHDRGLERRQGFIGIPLFFEAFRKQSMPEALAYPDPDPSQLGQSAPESFYAIVCALPGHPSVVPDFEHRTGGAVPGEPLLSCDRQMRFGPRGHQLGFPPLDPEPSLAPQSPAQAERMSHRPVHREGGEPPLGRAIGIAKVPQGLRLKSQGRHGRV